LLLAQLQAAELKRAGFIVMYDERFGARWFVGLGSHGDSGKTLRKATKRCLRCCKIGKWWKLPDGRLARDVAMEILDGA